MEKKEKHLTISKEQQKKIKMYSATCSASAGNDAAGYKQSLSHWYILCALYMYFK